MDKEKFASMLADSLGENLRVELSLEKRNNDYYNRDSRDLRVEVRIRFRDPKTNEFQHIYTENASIDLP